MSPPTPRYDQLILAGLQHKSHVYQGTVPADERAARRRRKRAARRARALHRIKSKGGAR